MGAEGALEVRKFDDRDQRVGRSAAGLVADGDTHAHIRVGLAARGRGRLVVFQARGRAGDASRVQAATVEALARLARGQRELLPHDRVEGLVGLSPHDGSAVDEGAGRAADAQERRHAGGGVHSSADAACVEALRDHVRIQARRRGVAQEILALEISLVLEEETVDAPEGFVAAKVISHLGQLGGLLGVLVEGQGQVAEHHGQVFGIGRTQPREGGFEATTEGALEV